MASRRTRANSTIGTRITALQSNVEELASRSRGGDGISVESRIEYLETVIGNLVSVNARLAEEYPFLDDRYAAPRTSPRGLEVSDWNTATENGWYWSIGAAANNPVGNIAVGHVLAYGPDGTYNRIMQEVWFPSSSPSNQYRSWRRVGSSDQSGVSWTWTDWIFSDITSHTHSAADITSGTLIDAVFPERLGASATLLSSQDLDAVVDSGWYVQTSNANATVARNYPVAQAGFLEVIRRGAVSGTQVGVLQRYTEYSRNSKKVYQRTWYGTWGGWVELTAPDWNEVVGKPTTFAPSSHTHPWSQVTGTPSTYPPSSHTHTASDVSSGVLNIARIPSIPWSQITDAPVGAISGPNNDDPLSSYPRGVTYTSVGSGFPASIGTLMTVNHSDFRAFQHFYDRGDPAKTYFRTADGATSWRPWQLLHTGNMPGVAIAVAAGSVSGTFAAGSPAQTAITVTLPSGRFSQAPMAFTNLNTGANGSQKVVPRCYAQSTTSLTLGLWTGDTSNVSPSFAFSIQWFAVQMSESSAGG